MILNVAYLFTFLACYPDKNTRYLRFSVVKENFIFAKDILALFDFSCKLKTQSSCC